MTDTKECWRNLFDLEVQGPVPDSRGEIGSKSLEDQSKAFLVHVSGTRLACRRFEHWVAYVAQLEILIPDIGVFFALEIGGRFLSGEWHFQGSQVLFHPTLFLVLHLWHCTEVFPPVYRTNRVPHLRL